jgi:hypothetical protein
VTWYKQRHGKPLNTKRRHIGICLTIEEWAAIEAHAAVEQESLAHVIQGFLADLVAERKIVVDTRRKAYRDWPELADASERGKAGAS